MNRKKKISSLLMALTLTLALPCFASAQDNIKADIQTSGGGEINLDHIAKRHYLTRGLDNDISPMWNDVVAGDYDGGWWRRGIGKINVVSEYKHYKHWGNGITKSGKNTKQGGFQPPNVISKGNQVMRSTKGNVARYDWMAK